MSGLLECHDSSMLRLRLVLTGWSDQDWFLFRAGSQARQYK